MKPRLANRPPKVLIAAMAVLVACVAAGCGTGYSGSKSNQVRQWASQYSVISNDQLVVNDVTAIRASIRARQLKDVTSNCAGLVVDAGTGYGNLPTPDTILTAELNTAYEDFASAGGACAGAQSLDSAKITAALGKVGSGLVSLDQATRLLGSDGVH